MIAVSLPPVVSLSLSSPFSLSTFSAWSLCGSDLLSLMQNFSQVSPTDLCGASLFLFAATLGTPLSEVSFADFDESVVASFSLSSPFFCLVLGQF